MEPSVEWLDVDSVGRMLSISRSGVYRLCRDGVLTFHKMPRSRLRRFDARDVRALIEGMKGVQ